MSTEVLAQGLRAHRQFWLMSYDAAVLLFSYVCFALLRYDAGFSTELWRKTMFVTVAAIALQWTGGTLLRIYQGRAIVASLEELLLLGVTTAASGLLIAVANTMVYPYFIARSIPFGATFMAICLMVLLRTAWRRHQRMARLSAYEKGESTLVFGAGEAGRQLVWSMLSTAGSTMRPVGLLDDDRWKRRLRVAGVRVLGKRGEIAAAVKGTCATAMVIAMPSAASAVLREVSKEARAAGLEVKLLPRVHELFSETASIRDIRDIDVTDLLGRGPIDIDIQSVARFLAGKRVLVTGAGGSIGSELCRQIRQWNPEELIMLDRNESALHAVQLTLQGRALLDSNDTVLADIRDTERISTVFRQRKPEVVFHAAALKHLPMLEQAPREAIKTNVLGTLNVLKAAQAAGVERFVNISTDKAADPTSVLGYSKRIAERVTSKLGQECAGIYVSVRFGNVLGSQGSVLTTFASQIATDGPITVTHPEVTRYFMTISEAVQLVIQAGAIGRDGEALILDMGEPVRVADMARQLIEIEGKDIEIVYTGLRPGEKLHEVLMDESESDYRPLHSLVSHISVSGFSPDLIPDSVTSAPKEAKEWLRALSCQATVTTLHSVVSS